MKQDDHVVPRELAGQRGTEAARPRTRRAGPVTAARNPPRPLPLPVLACSCWEEPRFVGHRSPETGLQRCCVTPLSPDPLGCARGAPEPESSVGGAADRPGCPGRRTGRGERNTVCPRPPSSCGPPAWCEGSTSDPWRGHLEPSGTSEDRADWPRWPSLSPVPPSPWSNVRSQDAGSQTPGQQGSGVTGLT